MIGYDNGAAIRPDHHRFHVAAACARMTVPEVADQFGIPAATVRKYLRTTLRQYGALAADELAGLAQPPKREPRIPDGAVTAIVREVAAARGVPSHRVFGPGRDRAVVAARHDVIREIASRFGASRSAIARELGMDHSSVCYVLSKARNDARSGA